MRQNYAHEKKALSQNTFGTAHFQILPAENYKNSTLHSEFRKIQI